jgi:hypothetical protein
MFGRVLRQVIAHKPNLAIFSAAHLEASFEDVDNRSPGTTTRLRHVKLIDRVYLHSVEVGVGKAKKGVLWPGERTIFAFGRPYQRQGGVEQPQQAACSSAFGVGLLLASGQQ